MRILIVEDDPILSRNVTEALNAEGFSTESVFDGQLAERMLKKERFDCVILDINLPGRTGFDVCRDLRKYDSETPVLMVTAFSELDDKIKGFDQGADDYLTKPFYMRELVMRVHSLLRRTKGSAMDLKDNWVNVAGITIDRSKMKVIRKETEIALTPREYQILLKLCENPGEIVSKNELIAEIWGRSVNTNTNTIEVYVNFLRNKLDKPFGRNSIRTKVGYGYYLQSDEDKE